MHIQKHVCLESYLGFATEKNLELSYYPNKEFVFKIAYGCILTTSVGAVFCSFT